MLPSIIATMKAEKMEPRGRGPSNSLALSCSVGTHL